MDWGTVLSWLFGIISTLLGGLNIFQWITLKSYKRVKEAEADRMEIENLRLVIQTMQSEIGRLQSRVEEAERVAMENSNKYHSLQNEFEQYKLTHK